MRKYYKYCLEEGWSGARRLGIYNTPAQHREVMGGYHADEAYQNREAFFREHFWEYQQQRLVVYDRFVRKHLQPEEKAFSVASGRSALELFLLADGFRITASELEFIPAYAATKRLFPDFEMIEFDILKAPPPEGYDVILAHSLIYLFDQNDLKTFLSHAAAGLAPGGRLIFDLQGAAGWPTWLVSDVLWKYELYYAKLLNRLFSASTKTQGLVIQHHGYRRHEEEIIEAAVHAGLKLVDRESHYPTHELARVNLLRKWLIDPDNPLRLKSKAGRLARALADRCAYVRLFCFQKK